MNKYDEELRKARFDACDTARANSYSASWATVWATGATTSEAIEWAAVWAVSSGQTKSRQIEIILKRIKK